MGENPERFIESNIDSSGIEYLGNMSTLGTWCDHFVIQAVADIPNLRIHIVESDENFALFNIVEAVKSVHEPTVVYIGHLGEYHYVSTLQLNSRVPNVERNLTTMKHVKQKQKRKECMKEYMKRKRLNETSENRQKRNQQNKEYMKKKRLSENLQIYALSLNIRPHKVVLAAQWLVESSSLNRDEGITFNDTWLERTPNVLSTIDDDNMEKNVNDLPDIDCDTNNTQSTFDDKDQWSEDEAEISAGVTDAMLTAPDIVTDNEPQYILNVAPGEGSRPMSIFRDKYSEELAYPGIFLGQKRPDSANRICYVHHSEICKSELRRSDRRAQCVWKISFSKQRNYK